LSSTAATFDQARADFEKAWQMFSARRTEADYQAWRDQEAWTAEKYRRIDRGERMAHDWRPEKFEDNGRPRCTGQPPDEKSRLTARPDGSP
jgi:hypothetical protein